MNSKPHPLNLTKLLHVMATCIALKIRYGFGDKIHDLAKFPPAVRFCDCSGAIRYLIYQATGGFCTMPDGSVNQHSWCEEQGLHKLKSYRDIAYADPFRVFICFIAPTRFTAGHVWLVNAGMTLESHGHSIGFDRRSWRTPVLWLRCCAAYELPVEGVHPNV